MKLNVENMEHNMAKLTIEVPAADFEKAVKEVYNRQKNSISLPGFRKGKVPFGMVEKMYGSEIFYEDAANNLIRENYGKAYDEADIEIVSRPDIEVTQIEKGKDFIFTAEVAVKPEVKLGAYKGLKASKEEVNVTEEDVLARLKEEQEKNSRLIEITDRAVEDGDQISLDFEGSVDGVPFEGGKGENFDLEIGSGSFIPGFEEQLVGAKIGEDLDVNVTFPAEYHAEELAGKDAVFACKVNAIKAKELPELDDEFASDISEFETLEELKNSYKEEILKEKEEAAKSALEEQVIDQAIENAEMDIPEAMIDSEADQMLQQFAQQLMQSGISLEQYAGFMGKTVDAMRDELRPQAEKRIKTGLVLEAVAKAENIEVSEEDFDAELTEMATMYGLEREKLESFMGEKEKENVKKDMASKEAVKFLSENAVTE